MIEESEQLYKLPVFEELIKKSNEQPSQLHDPGKTEYSVGDRWIRWVKAVDN